MGKMYTFDVGTRLRTTLNADISGYSSVEYKIKKPDGTLLTKPCFIEDQATGIVYYDTILNDLSVPGSYSIQTQIVFASGNQNESVTQHFLVHDSFN